MDGHVESAASAFKDRYALLVCAGILQALLGVACLLLVGLMLFALVMLGTLEREGMPGMSVSAMLPGMAMYCGGMVWFLTMGIGSLLARRWARDLSLASSWIWLVMGTAGFVAVLLLGPDIFSSVIPEGERAQAPAAHVLFAITLGMLSIIYLLIPGVLVLLYSGRNVAATCAFRDPQPRWTGRMPLPVLAVFLLLLSSVMGLASLACYRFAFPFFGVIISGVPGAVVMVFLTAAALLCAWGYYRLRPWAWACSVALVCLWAASTVITFARADLREYYEATGMPREQVEMTVNVMQQVEGMMIPMTLLAGLGCLGYLLFIRRYFHAAAPEATGPETAV